MLYLYTTFHTANGAQTYFQVTAAALATVTALSPY